TRTKLPLPGVFFFPGPPFQPHATYPILAHAQGHAQAFPCYDTDSFYNPGFCVGASPDPDSMCWVDKITCSGMFMFLFFTTRTGCLAHSKTAPLTLPRSARVNPCRPCEPIMI